MRQQQAESHVAPRANQERAAHCFVKLDSDVTQVAADQLLQIAAGESVGL
jgi:hypothetical protein